MNNKYIVYPNGRELHDFRELLNYSTTTFADNVAYVYKDDYTKKDFLQSNRNHCFLALTEYTHL